MRSWILAGWVAVLAPREGWAADSATAPVVEISFGSTLLFIQESIYEQSSARDVVSEPVVAVLFLSDVFLSPELGLIVAANIPLATQRTIVDGELQYEYAAPTISAGVRWTAATISILQNTDLTLQLGATVGSTLGSVLGDRIFPMLTSRLHLSSARGLTMYLGSGFAFQKDTIALLYGIGNRF